MRYRCPRRPTSHLSSSLRIVAHHSTRKFQILLSYHLRNLLGTSSHQASGLCPTRAFYSSPSLLHIPSLLSTDKFLSREYHYSRNSLRMSFHRWRVASLDHASFLLSIVLHNGIHQARFQFQIHAVCLLSILLRSKLHLHEYRFRNHEPYHWAILHHTHPHQRAEACLFHLPCRYSMPQHKRTRRATFVFHNHRASAQPKLLRR